jgi:predicted tellurium resistance membrane protein TerC
MTRFVETHPQVYTREDLDEREAKRRAVVYGLLGALISAMLTIGAIASLVVALG